MGGCGTVTQVDMGGARGNLFFLRGGETFSFLILIGWRFLCRYSRISGLSRERFDLFDQCLLFLFPHFMIWRGGILLRKVSKKFFLLFSKNPSRAAPGLGKILIFFSQTDDLLKTQKPKGIRLFSTTGPYACGIFWTNFQFFSSFLPLISPKKGEPPWNTHSFSLPSALFGQKGKIFLFLAGTINPQPFLSSFPSFNSEGNRFLKAHFPPPPPPTVPPSRRSRLPHPQKKLFFRRLGGAGGGSLLAAKKRFFFLLSFDLGGANFVWCPL